MCKGTACIHVTDENNNLTAFVSASYADGDAGRSIEILSVVNRAFKLIHERKEDMVCAEADKMEKKSLLLFQEDSNYVGVQSVWRGERQRHTRRRGAINVPSGAFLPVGANLLLLRRVAQLQFSGDFQTWTIDIDGRVCLSDYVVEPPQMMWVVGGKKRCCHVIKIVRVIRQRGAEDDIKEVYHYLAGTGHLLRYESCFSDFVWHINPSTANLPSLHGGSPTINWQNDVQLLSMYLDKKTNLEECYSRALMNEHPEVKNIIRDYLIRLVEQRPENVLDFTLNYFVKLRQQN